MTRGCRWAPAKIKQSDQLPKGAQSLGPVFLAGLHCLCPVLLIQSIPVRTQMCHSDQRDPLVHGPATPESSWSEREEGGCRCGGTGLGCLVRGICFLCGCEFHRTLRPRVVLSYPHGGKTVIFCTCGGGMVTTCNMPRYLTFSLPPPPPHRRNMKPKHTQRC